LVPKEGGSSEEVPEVPEAVQGDLGGIGRSYDRTGDPAFDLYQEGFMKGMDACRAEAMQKFSEERQTILEDEAERIEKKVAKAKKTKKTK
jgi:hypothetical protein